jgi:hypothetical protein
VVVIDRISWRPWPRSNVTWAGGETPVRVSEQGLDAVTQDRLVAFDSEDVFPVSFQDLLDVAPVDVERVGGDHHPRQVTRLLAAWLLAAWLLAAWLGGCDLVEQGDHLGLFPGVLRDFALADDDAFSVGERGEQPDLARPGVDLLPGEPVRISV